MTNDFFFDTDCISAFLWVNNESLLEEMYSGKIIIPKEVYEEINKPNIPHLKARVDEMVKKGTAKIMTIDICSEEYKLYKKLTTYEGNNVVIGKGEAASISLAKKYKGVLASNNFKDIRDYVEKFSLKHVTTGDLLIEAMQRNLITEEQGNEIWRKMLKKKRKIGADSFTNYIKMKNDKK